MGSRQELSQILQSIVGSGRVHYQPPESIRLQYPCIIYRLAKMESDKADNIKYRKYKRYNVLFISNDPDDPIVEELNDLPYCSHQDRFVSDNLYHDPFILYF